MNSHFQEYHKENEGLKMGSFQEYINEYRKQLKRGAIKEAYKGFENAS
jgi:hypothetical protein